MVKQIWLLYKRKVGTRDWELAFFAGVHCNKTIAQAAAKRFEDESVGWKYTIVKYNKETQK
jgi:hypothetical protein